MSHTYICKNNPRIARERYIKIHIYLIEKLERGGYTKTSQDLIINQKGKVLSTQPPVVIGRSR